MSELRGVTYGGMEPSSLIHGQESVTVDPFNADDPLRNRKELQDTWVRQTACFDDPWNDVCVFLPLSAYSGTGRRSTVRAALPRAARLHSLPSLTLSHAMLRVCFDQPFLLTRLNFNNMTVKQHCDRITVNCFSFL